MRTREPRPKGGSSSFLSVAVANNNRHSATEVAADYRDWDCGLDACRRRLGPQRYVYQQRLATSTFRTARPCYRLNFTKSLSSGVVHAPDSATNCVGVARRTKVQVNCETKRSFTSKPAH